MKEIKITNEYNDTKNNETINKYFNDIRKYEPTDREEEHELIKKIKNGDEKAKEELIKRNLKYVITVAKKYNYDGVELQDLINEGNIGLIKAAEKHNSDISKFITYANWWIRQSIIRYIQESHHMKVPINKMNIIYNVQKTKTRLEQKLQREPSTEDIYKEMDKSELDVYSKKNLENLVKSLEEPFSIEDNISESGNKKDTGDNEDNMKIHDTLTSNIVDPENSLLLNDNRDIIKKMFKNLTSTEKKVLNKLYGLDGNEQKSTKEISKELGKTQVRINQIKTNTIKKLKSIFKQENKNQEFYEQRKL